MMPPSRMRVKGRSKGRSGQKESQAARHQQLQQLPYDQQQQQHGQTPERL